MNIFKCPANHVDPGLPARNERSSKLFSHENPSANFLDSQRFENSRGAMKPGRKDNQFCVTGERGMPKVVKIGKGVCPHGCSQGLFPKVGQLVFFSLRHSFVRSTACSAVASLIMALIMRLTRQKGSINLITMISIRFVGGYDSIVTNTFLQINVIIELKFFVKLVLET